MAVKKKGTTTASATRTKAGGKGGAKKAAGVGVKATKKAAPKATAKKAAAPAIKLTPAQSEFLKRVKEQGEAGYRPEKKTEQRTLDALVTRKLLRRGAKDKATGMPTYTVSKAGEKHLATTP